MAIVLHSSGHLVDVAGPQLTIAGGLLFLAIAMGLTAAIGSDVYGATGSVAGELLLQVWLITTNADHY